MGFSFLRDVTPALPVPNAEAYTLLDLAVIRGKNQQCCQKIDALLCLDQRNTTTIKGLFDCSDNVLAQP